MGRAHGLCPNPAHLYQANYRASRPELVNKNNKITNSIGKSGRNKITNEKWNKITNPINNKIGKSGRNKITNPINNLNTLRWLLVPSWFASRIP